MCQVSLEHQYVSHFRPWLPFSRQGGVCNQGRMVRAIVRQVIAKVDAGERIPLDVWRQNWEVSGKGHRNGKTVGCGQLALKHLAPYHFRVAISSGREERVWLYNIAKRHRLPLR